jgi:glycosyltransferase involved in cell wall biosynthesis
MPMKPSKQTTIAIITFPAGGPLTWGRQLVTELSKRGYSATLFAGRKEYILSQLRYFDIVHTCVPLPNPLCRKYILTIHGNYKEEKPLSRFLFPIMEKRAYAITTPSSFLKKKLSLKNALIIPNGIEIPAEQKNDFTFHTEYPTIGILTNFHFRQKAEGVLHLARIVHKAAPEAKLLIGGDGTYLDEYQEKTLSIHTKTEFLGHCQKEDLFSRTDIFAYYSIFDNQPITILESMAQGLPTLTNDVGDTKNMMDDVMSAYCFSSDTNYATMLKVLITSPEERMHCGQRSRVSAQRFDKNAIMEKYLSLYQ